VGPLQLAGTAGRAGHAGEAAARGRQCWLPACACCPGAGRPTRSPRSCDAAARHRAHASSGSVARAAALLLGPRHARPGGLPGSVHLRSGRAAGRAAARPPPSGPVQMQVPPPPPVPAAGFSGLPPPPPPAPAGQQQPRPIPHQPSKQQPGQPQQQRPPQQQQPRAQQHGRPPQQQAGKGQPPRKGPPAAPTRAPAAAAAALEKEKSVLEDRLRRNTPFICNIRFENNLPEVGAAAPGAAVVIGLWGRWAGSGHTWTAGCSWALLQLQPSAPAFFLFTSSMWTAAPRATAAR